MFYIECSGYLHKLHLPSFMLNNEYQYRCWYFIMLYWLLLRQTSDTYDSGYSEWSGWPTTQAVEQCGSCQARLQKPAKSSPEDDVTCPWLPDRQAAAYMYRAPAVRTAAYLSCHDPSQNYAIHCGTPARQPTTSPLQHVALAKYWNA